MILALAFGALHEFGGRGGRGFEVSLLNGCGPNLCFPKVSTSDLDRNGAKKLPPSSWALI